VLSADDRPADGELTAFSPVATAEGESLPQKGLRRSLAEEAYRKLKDDILHNVFPPEFQATEVEMANRLTMSRTPMREALLRLQSEGLIEVTPRRGLRVLPIYPADLREIYELLCTLEASAAELFAKRQLPEDAPEFREMEETNEKMKTALEGGDRLGWAAMDGKFHRLVVEHCGNSRIRRVTFNVWDQSHRARIFTAPLRPAPTESYKEHRAVLEAIKRGDGRVASEIHRAHRYRGMVLILKLLEDHEVGRL
jgi:DNA-binding GntR family transcriptional regulator